MKIKNFGLSDIGSFRKNNQDFYGYSKNKNGDFFAIVCDGMGGHAYGEVASKIAVESFLQSFRKTTFDTFTNSEVNRWLRESVKKIVIEMKKYSENHIETSDMGTTLTAILFTNGKAFVVNIGDSRIYKYKNNKIYQLTKDQNLWNSTPSDEREKIKSSGINVYGNKFNEVTYWKILISALGPEKQLNIDTYVINDISGTFFLTSDGVHDYVDEETMIEIISTKKGLKSKAKEMINFAKGNLSTDNLTILILNVKE